MLLFSSVKHQKTLAKIQAPDVFFSCTSFPKNPSNLKVSLIITPRHQTLINAMRLKQAPPPPTCTASERPLVGCFGSLGTVGGSSHAWPAALSVEGVGCLPGFLARTSHGMNAPGMMKAMCARVDQLLILGMGDLPPLIGILVMGPYKPLRNWVDEFIPYYMEIMGV